MTQNGNKDEDPAVISSTSTSATGSNKKKRYVDGPVSVDMSEYGDESYSTNHDLASLMPTPAPKEGEQEEESMAGRIRNLSSNRFSDANIIGEDTEYYSNPMNNTTTFREDDEDKWLNVSEDIYSLIFTCSVFSQSFVFGIVVFTFQLLVIWLILYNLIDFNNTVNPLQVPPGVVLEVHFAQAFAMILAVATQGDMILSVTMFLDTHNKEILQHNPNATKMKWFFSNFCRFLSGTFLLIDVFVLLIQGQSVIDLMLNFAALEFVGQVDNVGFQLAKNGFISNVIQYDTLLVGKYKFKRRTGFKSKKYNRFRKFLYFLVTLGLLMGWMTMVIKQRNGTFLCQTVFVQFSDEFNPALSYFSGLYDQHYVNTNNHTAVRTTSSSSSSLQKTIINHRVVYTERITGYLRFAYCDVQKAWTLSYTEGIDPCINYLAISSPTVTFDITESYHTGMWFVVDTFETNQTHPFDHFIIRCNDCDVACTIPENGVCSSPTTDTTMTTTALTPAECVCNDNRFGLNCEFKVPCPNLDLDLRTNPFPFEDINVDYEHTTKFSLLVKDPTVSNQLSSNIVTVYNKPVYIFVGTDIISIIFFLGRRWILTLGTTLGMTEQEIKQGKYFNEEFITLLESTTTNNNTAQDIIIPFLTDDKFHGLFSGYRASFMSDPMDVGTKTDDISPVGLQWHRARYMHNLNAFWADETRPSGTLLLCSVCDDVMNDCYHLGICSNTTLGKCDCFPGFDGHLCEREHLCTDINIKCFNNGTCDTLSGICRCPSGSYGPLCQF